MIYFPMMNNLMNNLVPFVRYRPHPISHSEINQSLHDLPSSGLIVLEVLVVCLVNQSWDCHLWVEMSGEGRLCHFRSVGR